MTIYGRLCMFYIHVVSWIGNRRHDHDWGMVPVSGGLRIPHPHFAGLAEHRAECLKCGKRPAYRSPEYEQAQLNHNRRVTAMLEARGE